MDIPHPDPDAMRRTLTRLREELKSTCEEIALLESGTVDTVLSRTGRRTSVNEYTLRRLYRERDGLQRIIRHWEEQLDA